MPPETLDWPKLDRGSDEIDHFIAILFLQLYTEDKAAFDAMIKEDGFDSHTLSVSLTVNGREFPVLASLREMVGRVQADFWQSVHKVAIDQANELTWAVADASTEAIRAFKEKYGVRGHE